MNEYEIKCNKADFQNDFKKRKHIALKREVHHPRTRVPNYFWYVAPIKAIPLCIPDYAGLILVSENKNRYATELRIEYIKKAQLLHKIKVSEAGIKAMLRSLMFKYWKLAEALDRNKIQKELFTN